MPDSILYILLVVCGYFIGKVHAYFKLAQYMVANNIDINKITPKKAEPTTEVILKLEKVTDVYYAYANSKFVGQSRDFIELFKLMRNHYKVTHFVLDNDLEGFSNEEKESMLKAIFKVYNDIKTNDPETEERVLKRALDVLQNK